MSWGVIMSGNKLRLLKCCRHECVAERPPSEAWPGRPTRISNRFLVLSRVRQIGHQPVVLLPWPGRPRLCLIAQGQRPGFHLQIDLGADVGRFRADIAMPGANGADRYRCPPAAGGRHLYWRTKWVAMFRPARDGTRADALEDPRSQRGSTTTKGCQHPC